jgi:cation transport regulator ChaB
MPYEQITQLLDGAKINLPRHAMEIHDEALGSAAEQYGEDSRANRVAPALVRK